MHTYVRDGRRYWNNCPLPKPGERPGTDTHAILTALDLGPATRAELQECTGLTEIRAKNAINNLVSRRVIIGTGPRRGTIYKVNNEKSLDD